MTDETKVADDRRAPHVKPWRFSATAGELWNACPYAFSQKYELGIEEVASRPLGVGRLMAMTLERYLTHCYELRLPTDITAIEEIAREVYAQQGVGTGLDALDEVLRICSYYAEQHTLDIEHLAGVEVWLPPTGAAPLTFGGRDVIGKVDELYFDDGGRIATVRDAKSNWAAWSEREAREKLQARLYPLLVLHSFPDVEEVRIVYDFVRWGISTEIRWQRHDIEAERAKLEALVAQMEKPGPRPATPGDHCSICGYVSRCPVFKSARQNGVFIMPTNEDEATRVTETLLVLEAAVAQRRDVLRAYTKAHGPLDINGVQIGYFERKTPKLKGPRAFDQWARENGIDPFEHLTIPPSDLKRLMGRKRKKLPVELTEEVIVTQFGERRGEEQPVVGS